MSLDGSEWDDDARPPFGVAMLGHVTLGLFILSVPVLYLNTQWKLDWVPQPLGVLAVLANLPNLRLARIHASMLCLCGLWMFFALTAFNTDQQYVSDYFMVYGKFVALALLLCLTVGSRTQTVVVLGALAASAVIVAFASRTQLADARSLLGAVSASRVARARTAGVFSNANLLGTYAALSAMAALILAACTRRAVFWLLCVPSLASAAALSLYSGSRKAAAGMVLVCGFASWAVMRLKRRNMGGLVSKAAAVAVVAGGILWWRANPFASRFSTQEASFVVRQDLTQAAWEMWLDAPVLGWGYRAFELTDVSGLYTHSTPLEMLVNGGVVAFGLYLAFFAAGFRTVMACLAAERDARERVVLVGLGCCWTLLFAFSLFTVIIEETVFLVLSGCLCGILRDRDLELRSRPPWLPPPDGAEPVFGPPAETWQGEDPWMLSSRSRP